MSAPVQAELALQQNGLVGVVSGEHYQVRVYRTEDADYAVEAERVLPALQSGGGGTVSVYRCGGLLTESAARFRARAVLARFEDYYKMRGEFWDVVRADRVRARSVAFEVGAQYEALVAEARALRRRAEALEVKAAALLNITQLEGPDQC